MIKIKLSKFSKRENSTKICDSAWAEFECSLKDECTIINPVIELHTQYNINDYNYAHIPVFNRYYFISNIEYNRGFVYVYLTCDVLATYKTEIGASSEYVLRSASDFNGDISDDLYPCTAETYVKTADIKKVFDESKICYIIGILNNSTTNKYGAVKYYALSSSQLGQLMGFLLGNGVIGESENLLENIAQNITGYVTEIQNGVVRSLMNPSDYIVESYALPYTPPLGAEETLQIGWWPTPIVGRPVLRDNDFTQLIEEGYLLLGKHNDSKNRGNYLNVSPYTRIWLYLGVFGICPIDTLQVYNCDSVYFKVYGDIFGNLKCDIRRVEMIGEQHQQGALLETLSANVKCNFPIGQVSIDALGGAVATVSTVAGVLPSNVNSGDDLITGVQGVGNAIKAMLPQTRVSGSAGTFSGVFRNFVSYSEHHVQVSDDLYNRGRPLCEVRQISSLNGYILCCDADISISGTKEENQQIKKYMNSGFFYE